MKSTNPGISSGGPTPRIPDLLVERVHLGEASDAERALVLADDDARARLEALPGLDAAFLEAMPVDEEVRRIEGRARTSAARAQGSGNRPAVLSAVLAPLMAAGVAMLWVVATPEHPAGGGGLESTTAKGPLAPKLRVYRQEAKGVERLGAGAVARSGDVIQLGVLPNDATHGMVLSIDGRGTVTVHLPPGGQGSTELGKGEIQLPRGYELDDAPEYERFFLVSTNHGAVDVEGITRLAQRLARSGDARTRPLALTSPYDQTTFLLRKEER
jgi:hypothetical protein